MDRHGFLTAYGSAAAIVIPDRTAEARTSRILTAAAWLALAFTTGTAGCAAATVQAASWVAGNAVRMLLIALLMHAAAALSHSGPRSVARLQSPLECGGVRLPGGPAFGHHVVDVGRCTRPSNALPWIPAHKPSFRSRVQL